MRSKAFFVENMRVVVVVKIEKPKNPRIELAYCVVSGAAAEELEFGWERAQGLYGLVDRWDGCRPSEIAS